MRTERDHQPPRTDLKLPSTENLDSHCPLSQIQTGREILGGSPNLSEPHFSLEKEDSEPDNLEDVYF
jgi:hypothetical protein